MKNIFRDISSTRIALFGFILLFVGQAVTYTLWKVNLGELLANVGALLLIVGLLQWLFDENSRQALVKTVSDAVEKRIGERDRCGRAGIRDCCTDSKEVSSPPQSEEIEKAATLILGFQYSDGLVDRNRQLIKRRIESNRITQIVHIPDSGAAATYLSHWTGKRPNEIEQKVADMKSLIDRYFSGSPLVIVSARDVVFRYSFVYTESFIWVTFLTNAYYRQPVIPAIRIESGSPIYEFLKLDIAALGVSV